MEIKGVGEVNSSNNSCSSVSKFTGLSSSSTAVSKDSVKVSDEAKCLAEEAFILDILARIPDMDIDEEKISSIKEKLEHGQYDNKDALDTVAEKLMKVLGI